MCFHYLNPKAQSAMKVCFSAQLTSHTAAGSLNALEATSEDHCTVTQKTGREKICLLEGRILRSIQGLGRSKTESWDNIGGTAYLLTVHQEHFLVNKDTTKIIWKSLETKFQNDFLWKKTN